LVVVLGVIWFVVAQPSCRHQVRATVKVDPVRLRQHVDVLAITNFPRECLYVEKLDACADYIREAFHQAGAVVEDQPYKVNRRTYRNVRGYVGDRHAERIIVGAHYDVHESLPGADDNASGVAVLLELANLLGSLDNPPPVEFVAYTLEEPPFFATPQMGSAVHARAVADEAAAIRGVIVLEMVGYFSDSWGSQSYPIPLLHVMYPSRGNFISVIGRWDHGDWVKRVKMGMKGSTDLPVYSIRAPASLPGVDFSDHRNYWQYQIPALMVTDTAFYRNANYHTSADLPDTLDYARMADVTLAVFSAVQALSGK
jgi:Zn-dependent M28 family amino/carboxypeptidase